MMTRASLIDWASHWVPDDPPGQRARFVAALTQELNAWTPPEADWLPYPPGMGEESRRLHREYRVLEEAQRNGAQNHVAVIRLTDECAAKGIILVPGGEHL